MNVYPIRCKIRNDGKVTRVDVYDDIGAGGFLSDGLSAKDFAASLRGVKGALEVHINSGGGDVFDGIAIGNAIRAHKGPVSTVVDGIAASIASVIAQAGAERVMQPGSMMMIHDAFGMCVGDQAEMERMAATLGEVSDNIASIYAGRAGGTPESWRAVMRGEAWYTADDAVAAGLADRVGGEAAQMPAGLDVAAMVPGTIAARLRAAAPYKPEPYHVDADETVVCPECGKRNDTDAAYCDQCGTKLTGRTDVKEAPVPAKGSGPRFSAAMPDAVRRKFKSDLKSQPVHEIGAAIHRLAEWSASGHYPAGMSHADIAWMYSQCSKELRKRNPDSDAGGNLPAKSAQPAQFANCHFLVEATTAAAAAAGKHDHAEPDLSGWDPDVFRNAFREAK